MDNKFQYNDFEILCNKMVGVTAICICILLALSAFKIINIEIINTINVFLLGFVNLLISIVNKRKNIKISVITFIAGIAIIIMGIAGVILN